MSRPRFITASLFAISCISLALFVSQQTFNSDIAGRVLQTSSLLAESEQTLTYQPGLPARLQIPRLEIDAPIQPVALSTDGSNTMAVPDNFTDVGWYTGGPRPGTPGSAVITGHLNGKHVPEAVFFRLNELVVGDQIKLIDSEGVTLDFVVYDTKTYDYDAPTDEIFLSDTSDARLNLITCAGDWIKDARVYNQRTVVFTRLIE